MLGGGPTGFHAALVLSRANRSVMVFDTRRNGMFQKTFGGKRDIVDVVVVGAGAVGLSAALFLSRARRRTVVYDGGPTRNSTTEQVHEFLGHEGSTPAD